MGRACDAHRPRLSYTQRQSLGLRILLSVIQGHGINTTHVSRVLIGFGKMDPYCKTSALGRNNVTI